MSDAVIVSLGSMEDRGGQEMSVASSRRLPRGESPHSCENLMRNGEFDPGIPKDPLTELSAIPMILPLRSESADGFP